MSRVYGNGSGTFDAKHDLSIYTFIFFSRYKVIKGKLLDRSICVHIVEYVTAHLGHLFEFLLG